MKRIVVLIVLVLFLIPVCSTSEPAEALRFGKDTKISNADASFIGTKRYDGAGKSVSCSGDLNGDGYDDVVIGIPGWDVSGDGRGGVFIYFGKPSGWKMDTSPYKADASFLGENDNDQVGLSLAIIGDTNGDGYDDFLVSSSENDDAANNAGKIYLVFGSATGWSVNTSLANADATFLGEKGGDRAGNAVAGAGDVNNDGFKDILISSKYNDEGGTSAGQTYLIFGKDKNWTKDVSLKNSDASFIGGGEDDLSGYSISCAGDVNGDNYDDIIIGSPNEEDYGWNSERGKAYIFYGRSSGWKMDIPIECANASYIGEKNGNNAGESVSGAGDVNGDGLDDIIIGAPDYLYQSGTFNGIAYLIFGNSSGLSVNASLSKADASFYGSNQDNAGKFVSGAGDVNGDGFHDFLVTSPGSDIGSEVFLIQGSANNWSAYVSLNLVTTSFLAERSSARLGYALSGAGDVNGDGFDDILIGAEYDNEVASYSGQAYLIFPDNNSNPDSISSISIYSNESYTNKINKANTTDTVYIELKGVDGNSSRKDVVVVNITSNVSSPIGIQIRLYETGNNTGIYRGNFSIMYFSNEAHNWIKAFGGEQIVVSAFHDCEKKVLLNISNIFYITPIFTERFTIERGYYVEQFWSSWVNLKWYVETNASWLSLNKTNLQLYGTPGDLDVGKYRVKINFSNFLNEYFEINYTLTVLNKPSEIITDDVKFTLEDKYYLVHYQSTDENNSYWDFSSNAQWLQFNSSTRNLSGKPDNCDVGPYWVNISAVDNNNGVDFTNFTLVVLNVIPTYFTSHITSATEDKLYFNDYDTDDDPSVTYSLSTSADFLSINSSTGNLSGVPDNSDVGTWIIHIYAVDDHGGSNHTSFYLTVSNTPVKIITSNILNAVEHKLYKVDYNSTDDPSVRWYLNTDADFLSINSNTGELYGTPNNGDIGTFTVNITVDDKHGSKDYSVFTLTVMNLPPEILTVNVVTAYELKYYYIHYRSSDDNGGNVVWFCSTNASWLSLNSASGALNGTPRNDESGTYWVNISVNDGNGGSDFTNFTLTVYHVNPEIKNQDIETTIENELYKNDYNSTFDGKAIVFWKLSTNADFLSINSTSGVLVGNPDIYSSGYYWVNITVYDEYDGISSRNFTLKVIDDIPIIQTTNILTATEDTEYYVDYESDDDLKYTIKWYLKTNSNFLSIDQVTGELKGTPQNADVGSWWVNITAENHLGDKGYTNFTLTVLNTNDPPLISTVDITSIKEDEFYKVVYQVVDIDVGDIFTWRFLSSAPWLYFGIDNQTLWGTPRNNDVGEWWVKINVTDLEGALDEHIFNITVTNTNDPPVISTTDVTSCYEDENYYVKYSAFDVDTDDVIMWEMATNSIWLSWNPLEKSIYGLPGNDDVGTCWVSIKAKDLNGGVDEHNFTLTVLNTNDPPTIKTFIQKTAIEDVPYEINLNAVDIDAGDKLSWSHYTNAKWLKLGEFNSTLYGTPRNSDVGEYDVTIYVKDTAGATDEKQFTVTVVNVNDAPYISGAPSELELRALTEKKLDLAKYIFDVDNSRDDLVLNVNSDYAEVAGFEISFYYPVTIKHEKVELTVTDGIDISTPYYIDITVTSDHITIPKVKGHSPSGNNIPVNTKIEIEFNKDMDFESVTESFFITPSIPGSFEMEDATLIFTPDVCLSYNRTYTVIMDSVAGDNDGFTIGEIYKWQFTTVKLDTDGDGLPDDEDDDCDNDGFINDWEDYLGTDPKDGLDKPADTDGDGIPDGDDRNTKPWMDTDDDNDNLTDKQENDLGTDPLKKDTDEDGYDDAIDEYPLDPSIWKKAEDEPPQEKPGEKEKSNKVLLISAVAIIGVIVFLLIILLVLKPRIIKKSGEEKQED